MAVVNPTESSHLHLVGISSDGARVYLTSAQPYYRGGGGLYNPNVRPHGLSMVHTRAPPSQTATSRLGAPSALPGLMMPQRALQVRVLDR